MRGGARDPGVVDSICRAHVVLARANAPADPGAESGFKRVSGCEVESSGHPGYRVTVLVMNGKVREHELQNGSV